MYTIIIEYVSYGWVNNKMIVQRTAKEIARIWEKSFNLCRTNIMHILHYPSTESIRPLPEARAMIMRLLTSAPCRVNVQCLRHFCYAVPHNNRYTLLLENISLHFVQRQIFFLLSSLPYLFRFFLFLHPMPFSIPSFLKGPVPHFNKFRCV
jgi:hypothetical protein